MNPFTFESVISPDESMKVSYIIISYLYIELEYEYIKLYEELYIHPIT